MDDGWTWISFPVVVLGGMGVPNVMSGLSIANAVGDEIKDQYIFTQHYGTYGWFGNLNTFTTDVMYAIKVSRGYTSTFTFEGVPVELPKTVTLNDGWTYVPCPYQQSTPVAQYLPTASGVDYALGDQLKDRSIFTENYGAYGWFGTLTHVVPGGGYMLKTLNPSPMSLQTVTFAAASSGRRALAAGKTVALSESLEVKAVAGPTPADWVDSPAKYINTMTVAALVTLGGKVQGAGSLVAMKGAEVHGLQSTASIPPFGPYAGKSLYLIMVRADTEGEEISFTYYDGSKKVALDKTVKFAVNGKQGSVLEPFMLTERPKLFG